MLTYNQAHLILNALSEEMARVRKDQEAIRMIDASLHRHLLALNRLFGMVETVTGPQKDGGGVDLAALERCGPEPVPQPKRQPWIGH